MSKNKQRSKNTPEECAVIAKAWAEGKDIEYWSDCDQKWKPRPAPEPVPSLDHDLYRIKPEPRIFELWVSPSGASFTQLIDTRSAHIYTQRGWTKINVKEIVD